MLTLVDFIAALIVSWVFVYAIYGLTLVAVRSVWWTVRVVSWSLVHASVGVMLLVVYPVRWTARAVAWVGDAQPSLADSIVGVRLRWENDRTNAQDYCSNRRVDS